MFRTLLVTAFFVASSFAGPVDPHIQDSELNIPDPVEVSKDDAKAFASYSFLADSITKASELKASPCSDFYNYTCQHVGVYNYLMGMEEDNKRRIIAGLKKTGEAAWYRSLKQEFDKCVNRVRKGLHENGKALRKIFEEVNAELGPVFPLMENSASFALDASRLGEFVGLLAQKFRLNTFLSYDIQAGKLMLNDPKLAFPESYFVKSFKKFGSEYKASIKDYLTQLAEALNKEISEAKLNQVIDDVVKFESDLALLLSEVSDEIPVAVQASELAENNRAIDVNAFLARISKNAGNAGALMTGNTRILLTAPSKVQLVQTYLSQANPTTILNYLNIRLARSLRKYFMRKPKECVADQWLRQGHGIKSVGVLPPAPQRDPYLSADAANDEIEEVCLIVISDSHRDAVDRVYLDASLPDKQERKDFVERIKVITNKIINGFRFQIDQLSWFSQKVKAAAYKKIDSMLYHVVYDDWIEDDALLDERYARLVGDDTDDDFTAIQKMNDFAQAEKWATVMDKNRNWNFTYAITTVNAWYYPSLNHFYIPLGILQRPLFDLHYPAAVQYGCIGYVIGHELTHGFDSNGVNYDDQGDPNPWMDLPSKAKFNEMAQCVINEYNKLHGRGITTQTEDIADNGGIRSAFNAYKAEQGLYGPDPQLPGSPLNQFSQDQLFFLGFARTWCSDDPGFDYPFDPHSPLLARVLGTIQNTPAFQAAFNCPVGSVYAPKEHCDVWASEVKY
ncbi:unnamed protein product [Bursaphelenchus xylophilus]|uniref:(pine wood nematode) hypothetical protein n=1 Tax=Bursaphelenchus xylophilus TaxID=6326 RepID=A0A1I7SAV1_BURXY|nr:unnamed protein product [Bursaphelenchus xylophilus]CAG9126742.1 unnamed protein product [Bursaphelenchus xylophilus]